MSAFIVGLVSCGSSVPRAWSSEQEAMRVLTAAQSGDIGQLRSLAGDHVIVDVSRQSMTLDEFLSTKSSQRPLDKIIAAMSFEPGLRLSPLGDGTVQRLWVYPGFAITSPTCWSDEDKQSALDQSLMSVAQLDQFESDDAYRGFSVGFTEDGEWAFFLDTRVSRTPPNTEVAEELRCK
ncbi:MAG: hypothetical protein O3A54_07180 [Actinobacteria bacterium]|nr:hypothetical protein [Actinomycetota bacterium]